MDYLVNDHDLTHPPILITKFETGSHTFTPHPDAVVTKIEAQAAGGAGGTTTSTAATSGCGLANGGNGGNFISVLFEQKLLLSSFSVTVGSKGLNSSGSGVAGGNGGNIVIAGVICYGGRGGQTTSGTTAALIYNQSPNTNNSTNWSVLGNPIILHNVTGQIAQSGYIPREADHGFLKGSDGGDSFWGRGGRSDPAIYSGGRTNFRAIPNAGIGYGYGGAGAARGNRVVDRGLDGGEGVVIITEYF